MLILIYNAINKWMGKTILIRKPYKTNKNISRLFYILMMIIFVWFIGIQILGPDEQFFDQSGHSIIYNGTFTWKKSDGTKQNISVPGRYKVPAKQTMIITTTLPDDYNENVISTVNRIDNTRVVTRICCKFQTKFLSGICRRSIAEYITAGRVFAKSVQTFCIVLFSKFSINVKTYILKGRTDRDHILVIIICQV